MRAGHHLHCVVKDLKEEMGHHHLSIKNAVYYIKGESDGDGLLAINLYNYKVEWTVIKENGLQVSDLVS